MTSKLDVPLYGGSVNIVRRNRSALCEVLQSKFGCAAIIYGVNFDDDFSSAQQKKPANEDQPRLSVKLSAGVQVSVWRADLTSFTAEAVVNAANTRLQHVGGLALALSSAGGLDIQRESDKYIKMKGELKTGDAIVTSPGLLPCKKIIHAVGPDLQYSPFPDISRAEPLLKMTIKSILDRVSENRLQSVAIPAISSGIFNYPLPQCANAIVSAVKEYYKYPYSHKHLPKEICLVNNDEPSVQEMTRACNYSQAAGSKGREDAKTSTLSVQIGKVHLKLKKGNIEEERTDVIVNTASQDRDLANGCISRALLNKAGYEITLNILNFDCLFFHPSQILFESVSECLRLAVKNKHKSIAFPAIGTGALGFGKREVVQIMLTAVTEFAKKSQATLEVHVVIFPPDHGTFQAFEEQMRSHPGFEPGLGNRDEFTGIKAASPQISLLGSSEEATREADRWLQNLLFETCSTVRNNFILQFGEREDKQLSPLVKQGVSYEENFENGRASIIVKGNSNEDVAVARLKVEAILCKIQEEFVRDEKQEIQLLTKTTSFGKNTLAELSSKEFKDRCSFFKNQNLWISKVQWVFKYNGFLTFYIQVEKVENPALEMIFEIKKKQLNCSSSRTMFQCIPAQFLELVSRIGFHAWFAPPEDPAYGEGIYFAGTVQKAMKMWKKTNEEHVYFVEAEVLTGLSTPGKRGLILPPAVGKDPQMLYDSVSGGPDISVIFSGYQALPMYIITCKMQ
ncbi:protein mono-ADP-ribosyltransferase PARP9 [Tautogolabrus adspersus]